MRALFSPQSRAPPSYLSLEVVRAQHGHFGLPVILGLLQGYEQHWGIRFIRVKL